MILAGDIGGTKTNLAFFDSKEGSLSLSDVKSYPSKQFGSLNEILAVHLRDVPKPPTHAAFGVAGPVINGRCETTNLTWVVDAEEIARQIGVARVGLMNDLEATAYGVLRLSEQDTAVLQKGAPQQRRTIAVIAAGTGLGEGGLVWDGTRYRALASEGGHCDFSPRNDLEIDLLRYLLTRFPQVSWETVVSGPGLLNIYSFLRERSGTKEPAWLSDSMNAGDPPAVITNAGLQQTDSVCVATLDLFTSLYGAETGNLALKLLATRGVYVGGGIAPKIMPKILEGKFLESFITKDRYQKLMKGMPLAVILNDKTALFGAAHYALMAGG